MWLNVCVNEMAPFGPFAAITQLLLSRAKHPLTAMTQKEVCPQDEIADPPGANGFPVDRHGFVEGFFFSSYTVWCVIGSGEICSESLARVRSALGAGKGRNSLFLVCVGLNRVLNLDSVTLTHLITKGVVKEFRWRRGRNCLWCAEDGGRGVCLSDMNRLV